MRIYLTGAAIYAVFMLFWSLRVRCNHSVSAEIFATLVSAAIWPVSLPVDAACYMHRSWRGRQ